jgi:hypothetical protein
MPELKDSPVLHKPRRRLKTAATLPPKKSIKEKKEPPPRGFSAWWPFFASLVLAFLAPHIQEWIGSVDSLGMRIVFPFVLISGRHEFGMSEELTTQLPQLMLYLQFPLEGLLTAFSRSRGLKWPGCIGQILFLHFIGFFVLFLLSQPK